MLNLTVSKLSLQSQIHMMPFSHMRMSSITIDKSRFNKFANPFQFRSIDIKFNNAVFSHALRSAVQLDSNLLNNATSNNFNQVYQHFTAFNCYFLHCKNNISGGAFTSMGRDAIVMFERCFFEDCLSEKDAGALYIKSGSLQLTDNVFLRCSAYAAAQAIFAYGNTRNAIRSHRNSFNKCPTQAPDLQGAPIIWSGGEQSLIETNITYSKIVSGSGSLKSVGPYHFDGSYCYIAYNHGTSTMTINHNSTNIGIIVLQYFNIVNNTLEKDVIIQTDSEIYLKDSVIADNNVVVQITSFTPPPTKKPSKLSMDSAKKRKVERTPAPTVVKIYNVKLQNCGLDRNHDGILNEKSACINCNKIEGKYSLYPIPSPKTPGIRKATPMPPPEPYSRQVLMLCPFLLILIILIGLVMRTTNCQSIDEYVHDEFAPQN